jgi:two-component system nitrogen regulation sensor histidine kinase GlnL
MTHYASFAGLDLLASTVLLLDDGLAVRYVNPAGENLLAVSLRTVAGKPFGGMHLSGNLQAALDNGLTTTGVIPGRTSN